MRFRRYRGSPLPPDARARIVRDEAIAAAKRPPSPPIPQPLPCPCGSNRRLVTRGFKHPANRHRAYRCLACGLTGGFRFSDRDQVEAWNEIVAAKVAA